MEEILWWLRQWEGWSSLCPLSSLPSDPIVGFLEETDLLFPHQWSSLPFRGSCFQQPPPAHPVSCSCQPVFQIKEGKKKIHGAGSMGVSASSPFSWDFSYPCSLCPLGEGSAVSPKPNQMLTLPPGCSSHVSGLRASSPSSSAVLVSPPLACSWVLDIPPVAEWPQSISPAEVVKPGWGGLGAPTTVWTSCTSRVHTPVGACPPSKSLSTPHTIPWQS